MRICFWASDKARENILGEAFKVGAEAYGDEVVIRRLEPEKTAALDFDVAAMIGVKSRELYQAHWHAGINTVMIDKGYSRHKSPSAVRGWEYWRVAVNDHHPTKKLMEVARPTDRFERLGLDMAPWRNDGLGAVLIAGSSAKYHEFYGLRDPTAYTKKVARVIRELSPREIIYRPKPSWHDAVPIAGTRFSKLPETIDEVLMECHVTVTHGSNACFESVLAGVPVIVTGEAVAKPISSTSLDDVENPRRASDEERSQWLANLAYCQWTQAEFASGEAWSVIRPQILNG